MLQRTLGGVGRCGALFGICVGILQTPLPAAAADKPAVRREKPQAILTMSLDPARPAPGDARRHCKCGCNFLRRIQYVFRHDPRLLADDARTG